MLYRRLWDLGIATIFARELLEASIIIGQYRTVIIKSEEWTGENELLALRTVKNSSIAAVVVALIGFIMVLIPLEILSKELDTRAVRVTEGISKIVASICILQLSLKIPTFMGVYHSHQEKSIGDNIKEIRFNIAWNIWREVAECAVFIIPFILDDKFSEIPLSALIGFLIGSILGGLIYYANNNQSSKLKICILMSLLLVQLSIGLFMNGCHELELVWGETKQVWEIKGTFWDEQNIPMGLIKPFGYSSSRTKLQIGCFWGWTIFSLGLHYRKFKRNKAKIESEKDGTDISNVDIENNDSR